MIFQEPTGLFLVAVYEMICKEVNQLIDLRVDYLPLCKALTFNQCFELLIQNVVF